MMKWRYISQLRKMLHCMSLFHRKFPDYVGIFRKGERLRQDVRDRVEGFAVLL